jgi:hypothetical protein
LRQHARYTARDNKKKQVRAGGFLHTSARSAAALGLPSQAIGRVLALGCCCRRRRRREGGGGEEELFPATYMHATAAKNLKVSSFLKGSKQFVFLKTNRNLV